MPGPAVNVGASIKVTVRQTIWGQKIQNQFNYVVSTIVGTSQAQENVFEALHTKLTTLLLPIAQLQIALPPNCNIDDAVYQQRNSGVMSIRYIKPMGQPGLNLLDAATPNLACVIVRRGNIAKRTNISTIHVLLGGEGAYSGGELSVGQLAAMQALADSLPVSITTPVGASTYTFDPSIDPHMNAAQSQPLTNAQVTTTVRVMRRRTVGVGQ